VQGAWRPSKRPTSAGRAGRVAPITMNEKARQLLIRSARPEDLGHIVAIERVSFPTPWSDHLLASEMKRNDCVFLTAESEGRPIGYVAMWYFGAPGSEAPIVRADASSAQRSAGEGTCRHGRAGAWDQHE